MSDEQRLATLLARRGLASRRSAGDLIKAGRVSMAGQVVRDPAARVTEDPDSIRVDGKPLPKEPPLTYVLMFKPRGTIVSRNDPEGRPTVFDLLTRVKISIEPVGRLDFDTEGLLLFTNDGQLAAALTHPSNGIERTYLVKVAGVVSDETVTRMRRGRKLEDGYLRPRRVSIEAKRKGSTWLNICITEGRNRAVRRFCESFRHSVLKLRRIRFGPLSMDGMDRANYRILQGKEIHELRAAPEKARKFAEKLKKKQTAGAKGKMRP